MSFFEENAYQDVPRDDSSNWNFVMGNGEGEIDVHVMTLDAEGNGIYGPVKRGISYPAYAFECLGSIAGLKVRCISAEYHLVSHTGYALRDKDFHDVGRLCERFGLEPPNDYKNDL